MNNKNRRIPKIGNAYDPADEGKLRGGTLTKIKNDLKDFDGTEKEKLLAYSQHLNWCMKVFESIFKIQKMASTPGVWDKNGYNHGVANALISVMAIIVEEQGQVPHIKAPKKYDRDDKEAVSDALEDYIYRLQRALAQIVVMDELGPKGYGAKDNPVQEWINDTLRLMIKQTPVSTPKIDELHKTLTYELRKKNHN